MNDVLPGPVKSDVDLRDMLRRYLIRRSLDCMAESASRRECLLKAGKIDDYRKTIRQAVAGFYGQMPVGEQGGPVQSRVVSVYEKDGYRIENVLFDSFPGWEVNATVYVPTAFRPPFPVVVVPVGHSGKQFESYQLPCQFFARCGYLAIVFDPPGQASEKQPGNDHFHDGVCCYLVGESSSRYFVADAIRCVDYAQTRPDADLRNGVAMTGVSGGGTTTTLAGLLDDRITVLGPSCCLTRLADLDITQCYAGCPETHMFARYAEGIDEVDLLCAALPKPTLLMAGRGDEVFHIEDTIKLADQVKAFYRAGTCEETFNLFIDEAGHCYSLTQAREFVRFMNRWLRNEPDREIPPPDKVAMHPHDQCRCYPRTDINMRTLTLDRAQELARTRRTDATAIRQSAMDLAGVPHSPMPIPEVRVGEPFQVWAHYWQQILLNVEPDVEIPGTLLYAMRGTTPAVLHFDDRQRNTALYRHGPLTGAIRFCDDKNPTFGVLSVDLRGWGDSSPAMYPYELAGWGGIDRYLAYTSDALGDPVLAMRIRDGLASLAYLRSRPEVDAERIVLSGCGLGGLVALHVAAIDGCTRGVVAWDGLVSFLSLLETEHYTWPADAFYPNVLKHYDIPDLARSLACPVTIINPKDGAGNVLPIERAKEIYGETLGVESHPNEWEKNAAITQPLRRMLEANR